MVSIEKARATLDRVRRKHSLGKDGARRDVMAAADAYVLAVLEELDPTGRAGKKASGWNWPEYIGWVGTVRARIETLGKEDDDGTDIDEKTG